MTSRFLLISLSIVLVSLPTIVFAQQADRLVILDHADSLIGKVMDGEDVRELIGNVRFHQGSVVVTCDKALQFLRSNRVSLLGNVFVRDDTMTMRGKRGFYYGTERMAEAFDGVQLNDGATLLTARYGRYYIAEKKALFRDSVVVQDTASILNADELEYKRNEQTTIATGNVRLLGREDNISIFGGRLDHDRKTKFSRMTISPRVEQIDTVADGQYDTLIVVSRVLESIQDTLRRLIAIDSVRMWRTELAAEAGLAFFLPDLDSIILRRKPFVWYEDNQVSGDSIFLKLQRRKLQTAYVRGDAIAISVSDSLHQNRFNQMTGELITMRFTENKVQQIEVEHTATSLYYLYETVEDSAGRRIEPNGLNKTTGDRVVIEFENGKTDRISVLSGVEGQYYPEHLVEGREIDYDLPGFNWRQARPGKRWGMKNKSATSEIRSDTGK